MFAVETRYGEVGETLVADLLRSRYNDIRKTPPYCLFDLVSPASRLYVEVKRRRFDHDRYPTTLVPMNKIKAAEALTPRGVRFIFAFVFEDIIGAVEFPFEYSRRLVQRRDRPERGPVEHAEIDIELLRPITSAPSETTPAAEPASTDSVSTEIPGADQLAQKLCHISLE